MERLGKRTFTNRWRGYRLGCLAGCAGLLLSGCSSTPLVPPPAPAPLPPTSATVGTHTVIAIAPPAAPAAAHPTLPEFLGLTQACQGGAGLFRLMRDRVAARLGTFFPGLEPRPPLLTIADPANLSPDAPPSVQTAAKIKQEQDAGAQKAKAAAYLATVGCGCYEGVAEALAANLSDCNEEVRFATAKALREIGSNATCPCGGNSCCTLEVHQELMRLAWETDHTGCFVEPSPRVRRMARLALKYCCMPIAPAEGDGLPEEGPQLEEGEVLSQREPAPPAETLAQPAETLAQPAETLAQPAETLAQPAETLAQPAMTPTGQTAEALAAAPAATAPTAPAPTGVRPVSHTSWPEAAPFGSLPAVLAEVNGEPLAAAPVIAEVQRRLWARPGQPYALTPQDHQQMLSAVLVEAVDRRLLAQTARSVLSAAVQAQLAQQVAQGSGASPDQLAADPTTHALQLETALAQELLRRQVDHDPAVSAAEIAAVYESAPQRFRRPEQRRWRHYWIEHADGLQLTQIAAWLQYVRATALGLRHDAPPGYDDRWVNVQQYDWMTLQEVPFPTLRRRLQPLGAGQASEIHATPSATSFLLVDEVRNGERRPLSEVRSAIIAEILADRRAEAEAAYIDQLRSQARIRIVQSDSP